MENQACCAHCKVESKRVNHPDGTCSEYWECSSGCGMRFVPMVPNQPLPRNHLRIVQCEDTPKNRENIVHTMSATKASAGVLEKGPIVKLEALSIISFDKGVPVETKQPEPKDAK